MRFAELLCPLAAAADCAAALPPDTAQRTALIALGLGRAMGLPSATLSDLFYAALLRHLGCSATSHEETALMGDELELRDSLKAIDKASPTQMLRAASRGFARGRSTPQRVRRVARFMTKGAVEVPRIFGARCEVSAALGRRLGLSEASVRALDEAYERWDGKGLPRRKRGESQSPLSGILAVAELVALFLRLPGGEALALNMLHQRSGGELDPRIVGLLFSVRDEVVAPARRDAPLSALLEAEPLPHRTVPDARAAAQVLADFVDLKSTFTLGHSRRVATLARRAGTALGLDGDALELAGWLHDLGRVSVSNAIWDKPGPLDAGEWEKARGHALATRQLLRGPYATVAAIAAEDHERMNSAGYPHATVPSREARVLAAADVVTALLESRPHRPAFSTAQAAKLAAQEVEAGRLERAAVNAVLEAMGQADARVSAPRGLTERELDVLRLLVRGKADKEIAASLGISHRTVHHHNQSVFAKLEVTTRAGAALFAIENALV